MAPEQILGVNIPYRRLLASKLFTFLARRVRMTNSHKVTVICSSLSNSAGFMVLAAL